MSPSQPARRSPDAFDSRPSDRRDMERRDMGAELDNIFRLAPAAHETIERPVPERARPSAPVADQRRVNQTDLDSALDMLTRAAQAMDILQARYHQVESYARDIAERAERDLAQAYGQIKDLEVRAVGSESRLQDLKLRLDDAEGQAEAAQRRADLAERHADALQRRADAAERSATEAREWLECFHDKIVASFDTRPFPRVAAA